MWKKHKKFGTKNRENVLTWQTQIRLIGKTAVESYIGAIKD